MLLHTNDSFKKYSQSQATKEQEFPMWTPISIVNHTLNKIIQIKTEHPTNRVQLSLSLSLLLCD